MSTLLARFDHLEDPGNYYAPITVEYQDDEYWVSTPLLHKVYFSGATLNEALERIETEIKDCLKMCLEEGYSPEHNIVLTAWLRVGRDELTGTV